MIRAATVVAWLLALSTLAACSADSEGEALGPASLRPVSGRAPTGTVRVECAVAASSGRVRFALDLPDDFRQRRGCLWHTRVAMHDSDIAYSIDVVVTVRSEDQSLAQVHAAEQVNEVEGETPEGDDSILDLVLEQDVPALGPTTGDRLSWRCYCDGQDLITRMAQADGIRVTWSSVVALTEETNLAFARAVEGAGTVS